MWLVYHCVGNQMCRFVLVKRKKCMWRGLERKKSVEETGDWSQDFSQELHHTENLCCLFLQLILTKYNQVGFGCRTIPSDGVFLHYSITSLTSVIVVSSSSSAACSSKLCLYVAKGSGWIVFNFMNDKQGVEKRVHAQQSFPVLKKAENISGKLTVLWTTDRPQSSVTGLVPLYVK